LNGFKLHPKSVELLVLPLDGGDVLGIQKEVPEVIETPKVIIFNFDEILLTPFQTRFHEGPLH
jgi:hypothetical protein